MTTWGTTLYTPAPGCHGYRVADGDPHPVDGTSCTACGGHRWDAAHAVEERRAELPEGTHLAGLFAVEASDDNERSYASNGLRWVNRADAERWASGLALRWFGCTHIRVRATDEDGEPTGPTIHQTL